MTNTLLYDCIREQCRPKLYLYTQWLEERLSAWISDICIIFVPLVYNYLISIIVYFWRSEIVSQNNRFIYRKPAVIYSITAGFLFIFVVLSDGFTWSEAVTKIDEKQNGMKDSIKIFDQKKVRTIWDEETEEWYFSIVDVIEVLTETDRPRKYWNDLKKKLQKEGSELSEKIGQLKISAPDGKKRLILKSNTKWLINSLVECNFERFAETGLLFGYLLTELIVL